MVLVSAVALGVVLVDLIRWPWGPSRRASWTAAALSAETSVAASAAVVPDAPAVALAIGYASLTSHCLRRRFCGTSSPSRTRLAISATARSQGIFG